MDLPRADANFVGEQMKTVLIFDTAGNYKQAHSSTANLVPGPDEVHVETDDHPILPPNHTFRLRDGAIEIFEVVYPQMPPEQKWAQVRDQRNAFLVASDWTQLPDIPAATRAIWAAYRQQLRDITQQTDPFNISWPTAPVL